MSVAISQRHELPGHHHVARFCRPRTIRSDGRPLRDAFLLRPHEEYLSTNWLERFHYSDRPRQIAGVRQALGDKGFNVRPKGAFAVLNVGDTVSAIQQTRNLAVRFIALGASHDPSHTGIFGYPPEDTDTAAALLRLVGEMYPASE